MIGPVTDGAAGPLSGVRVVQLGGLSPILFTSMILGDLGADVVMVEPPTGVRMETSFSVLPGMGAT